MSDAIAKTAPFSRDGWILLVLIGIFVLGATAYSFELSRPIDSGHWAPKAEVFKLFRILKSVCGQYHTKYGEYPGASSGDGMADLLERGGEWSDQLTVLLDTIDGKTYHLTFEGGKNQYSCSAVPLLTDTLAESYYIDHLSPIRVERNYARNGPASGDSEALEGRSP